MKKLNAMLAGSLVLVLGGCATSSQVQEMIDASQNDFIRTSEENARSIDVLKRTAKDSLEKDREHAGVMQGLERQLGEASASLESLQVMVEATKVMSAKSIIKMSELKEAVAGNKSVMDVQVEKMRVIDDLYEKVLVEYYQDISESALAAIVSLQADNKPDDPVILRKPVPLSGAIEIVAPDTSSPTNAIPGK